MLLRVRAFTKGLERSISDRFRIRFVISLILASLFMGSCYASTDCNAGILTTCKCPNGHTETYKSLSDELKAAINNPESCCYYKAQTNSGYSITTYNPMDMTYVFGYKPPIKSSVGGQDVVRTEIPLEITAEPVQEMMPIDFSVAEYELKAEPIKEKFSTIDVFQILLRNLARSIGFHISSF
jgi:hypothetical protein